MDRAGFARGEPTHPRVVERAAGRSARAPHRAIHLAVPGFLSTTKFPLPGKLKGAELVSHLELVFCCRDAAENGAGGDGYGTAPAAYAEAAGHLRHARNHGGEAAVLARAIESGLGPGAGRRDISARLAALEGAGVHPNLVEAGMTADYPPPGV